MATLSTDWTDDIGQAWNAATIIAWATQINADTAAIAANTADIEAISEVADAAYVKPGGGIPLTDLATSARPGSTIITDILANLNDTTVPSTAAIKSYIDAAIADVTTSGTPSRSMPAGDGTSTDITLVHNLGTLFVDVVCISHATPKQFKIVPWEIIDINTIVLHNEEVWTTAQYDAIVMYRAQSSLTLPTPGTLVYSSSTTTSITYTFSGQTDSVGIARIDAYDGVTNTLIASNIGASPFVRSSLLSDTSYETYLKVTNDDGNSANTNTVIHNTAVPVSDTIDPTPGVLTAGTITATSIAYTFTAGSDNVAVVRIDAYDADTNVVIESGVTPTTYERDSLTPDTEYGTFMRYVDAAGNYADSNVVTETTGTLSSAITQIDSHSERTTTALTTMPTHAAGDLLVIKAYRVGFTTPPAMPSGWTAPSPATDTANTNCIRVGYKVAASSSEVSGTWTNCNYLSCDVYRNVTGVGAIAFENGNSNTPSLPALTLQNEDNTSWVMGGAGYKNNSSNLHGAAGMTLRSTYDGTSGQADVASYDTDDPVASFAGAAITGGGTAVGWESFAMELKSHA